MVLPGSTNTSTTLNFVYTYDAKNNILTKKTPDQALINYKYNNRDLPTYSQDGNLLAAGQWLNTQYDIYGRVSKTGIYTGTPANGDFVPASLTTVLTDNTYGTTGIEIGKLKTGKVKILGTANDLSTTYTYDVYGRIASSNGNNHLNLTAGSETHSFAYDFADNVLTDTRVHKPSGTQTYNLAERPTFDHAGRQSDYFHTLNGAETQISNQKYDAKDLLIERNIGKVTSPLATWLQSVDYTYNDQGWLTRINGNTLTGTNLVFPTVCTPAMPNPGAYTIAANPDPNDLFYLELCYDAPFSSAAAPSNFTGMTANSQKSGNIGQMAWKVKGRDRQGYNFTYDYLDRLKKATYYDVNSSNAASASSRFDETLVYDSRGNLDSLYRTSFYQNGGTCAYGQIDKLKYSYVGSNTNKLLTIGDTAPTTNNQRSLGFNPGAGGAGYTYDANGNLKTDTYKGITNIVYNHLNLPTSILWGTAKKIDIVYDAAGAQLSRTVYTTTVVDYLQDYVAGVEYRTVGGTRKLESIAHAEGRRYNTNVNTATSTEALRLEYSIRDHLGNNRLTFTDKNGDGKIDVTTTSTNEILSEQHYYPFGLSYGGSLWMNDASDLDNRYQYNGKELTADHGLGWYNYGARWYDASVGRWNAVDALADDPNQVDKSPFAYGWNNPVNLTDPDGNCPVCVPILAAAIRAVAGGGSDYVVQVAKNWDSNRSLGENLSDVEFSSIAISAGFSAIAPGGKGVGLFLKEAGLSTTESAAKQIASGEGLDWKQTVSDVAGDRIGGALTKNVDGPINGIKSMERQADRANRIANGDPTSSGRKETAAQAAAAVKVAKGVNTGTSTFVKETAGNSAQEGLNKIRSSLPSTANNRAIVPANLIERDNTAVSRALLPNPFNN